MKKKEEEKKKPKGKLLENLLFGPWKSEGPQKLSKDEWLAAIAGDIDPVKYSGEGWFATDEYAKPSDIDDPFVRAQVGHEEEYYPETYRRR